MKYIFDFDDVLFNNTAQFKEHMFKTLASIGIPEDEARKYYKEARSKGFCLQKFIAELLKQYNIINANPQEIHKTIITGCKDFVNTELIELVKKLGKENCFIVTNGEEDFQQIKITQSQIGHLFKEIYTTPGSKKDIIEKICLQHEEGIIFIDNASVFFEDLDFQKYPNLKTILYTGQNLENYLQ